MKISIIIRIKWNQTQFSYNIKNHNHEDINPKGHNNDKY